MDNIPKPQISTDYKRQAIRLSIVGISLIVCLAVGNAIYKSLNPKVTIKEQQDEISEKNEEIEITDNDMNIQYYDKVKINNTTSEINNTTENSNSNQNYNQNYNHYDNYDYKAEMMRAYYSKLIQEEEQARTSNIGFSKGTTNTQSTNRNEYNGASNNNLGYGNTNFPNQYAQQNMQQEKNDFLQNARQSKFYNSYQEEQPISKFEIMAGTFIPATLITGINSDLPSNSVAVVRENVYDTVTGNHLLIPKGTKIIGTYDSGVSFGQDRLLIVWQRLIFPNGKYIGLDNMGGIDLSGYAGFKGKVNNHFLKLLQAVVLSSAMGAGSAIVTDNDKDDWRSEAGKGAGQVILDFGNKMGEKILNRQPTIEIKQGYRFNIMVQSDLILTPYED
jgi:type IV secretory pathway VirB10-like protein